VKVKLALYFSLFSLLVVSGATVQSPGYRVSGLTFGPAGPNHQSPTLQNPWGMAFLPGGGFSSRIKLLPVPTC